LEIAADLISGASSTVEDKPTVASYEPKKFTCVRRYPPTAANRVWLHTLGELRCTDLLPGCHPHPTRGYADV